MSRLSVQVLLVEDNKAQANLTVEAFRDALIHCDITVVEDGEAALRFLRRESPYEQAPRPDLIILDLNLPKIDGMDVLRILKGDAGLLDIPVIVLSVSSNPDHVERAYKLQAAGYIVKPSNLDEYFLSIRLLKETWLKVMSLPKTLKNGEAAGA